MGKTQDDEPTRSFKRLAQIPPRYEVEDAVAAKVRLSGYGHSSMIDDMLRGVEVL